jgi:hypothetical protein
MANGDESLESRVYEYCKRGGCTTDNNDYAMLEEFIEEFGVTADELNPAIERAIAQKRLTYKWFKGEKRYAATTPRWFAEKTQAAQRGEEVLSEWFDGFDGASSVKKPAKPGAKKTGKPSKGKTPRLTWRYAPVPLAIVNDRSLSAVAVRIAASIAARINLGKWNSDLHVDISAADLAEWTVNSRRNVMRAIAQLKEAGHIKTESQGRGGLRFWFTDHADL